MPGTAGERRPRRSAAKTRAHILDVADRLFYWDGLHNTGVDKVARAADIAPTTLYRSFADKDDLVAAYVERADLLTREWIDAAIAASDGTPRSAILAVFAGLRPRLAPAVYRGCACQMTLAEYPDAESAPHRNAVAAKDWLHDRFAGLLADAGVDDPGGLAGQLMVIYDGALASAQRLRSSEPALHAGRLAEVLLDSREL
jgi:AcrR family transcriptional regulator